MGFLTVCDRRSQLFIVPPPAVHTPGIGSETLETSEQGMWRQTAVIVGGGGGRGEPPALSSRSSE